jgi:hypothetical protein
LEDAGIDFDFLDAGTVEFFEGGYDASLFASAGGSVDEEVRKVARLCLEGGQRWELRENDGEVTRERRRSERS